MKKLLRSISVSLMLAICAFPAIAQIPLAEPDSAFVAPPPSLATVADTGQVVSSQNRVTEKVRITRIPVKAGDTITVSATVLDNTIHKSRFWKDVAKVIVPSFVLGNAANQRSIVPDDHRPGNGNAVSFNAKCCPCTRCY